MKKSFTLIELLLSILIFSVLILAMSNFINQVRNSQKFIEKYSKNNNYLLKVLYYDLLNSTNIKIINTKNPNYDRLLLKTSNSLYNLINPYVVWYISNNSLIRIEDYNISLPGFFPYIDKFDSKVQIFKIYKKNEKIFVYIKGKKKLFFEIIIK